MVTPELTVLTPAQREKVHRDAVKVLERSGLQVEDESARRLFQKAAGVSCQDRRVRLPGDLIQWAIDVSPSSITIHTRTGKPCFTLKGDGTQSPVFGLGGTNLYYQDPTSRTIVPFNREYMADAVRLGNSLDGYDVISTPGIIQDIAPDKADCYGVLEMMAHTTKPLVLLISDDQSFDAVLDLCAHLAGDLAEKPFLIPYVNPVTPLVLNSETSRKMTSAIGRGLPVIFSNYGMSGATCPITPAGTLVLLTAELLAGLVYSQLVKKGTPIILGSLPAAFEMKHAGSFYSPQSLLLNLACVEMMTFYGVPHCGTSGSTNGWGADLLSATTLCLNHLSSCLGKSGLVPFVGGNFDSLVFSPELVVYANDVIDQSRKFAEGFSIEDEEIGWADMDRIGPAGNYLLADLTAEKYRSSLFPSSIWPCLSLEKWRSQGQPSAAEWLRKRTCELLERPQEPDDHAEIRSIGEAYLARM